VIPRIYLKRKIPVTNGKVLRFIVDKVCGEYNNGLLERKRERRTSRKQEVWKVVCVELIKPAFLLQRLPVLQMFC
jgi:hypothetical protein